MSVEIIEHLLLLRRLMDAATLAVKPGRGFFKYPPHTLVQLFNDFNLHDMDIRHLGRIAPCACSIATSGVKK